MNRLVLYTGVPVADEDDDGTVPIVGTNDGRALGFGNPGNEVLSHGDLMGAIAESGLVGTVSQVGHADYMLGRTFEHLEQQLVDFLVYAQMDTGTTACIGGWGYSPNAGCGYHLNHENSSRSVYGGLLAAKAMAPAGVYVNNRLLSRMASILKYTQQATSKLSFGLGCTTGGLYSETGDALLALGLLGWDGFTPGDTTPYVVDAAGATMTFGEAGQIFDDYLTALGTSWVSFQRDPCFSWISGLFYNDNGANSMPYLRTDRKGNIIAISALAGGLRSLDMDLLSGHDWRREFAVYLIRNQFSDGHWLDQTWETGWTHEGVSFHGPVNTVYGVETLMEPLSEPPSTEIVSGPAGATVDSTPTFEFTGGPTFECRVDAAAFGPCSSPYTTPSLAVGSHTFAVRAIDEDGVHDATPATRAFTVEAPPPPPPASPPAPPAGPAPDATPPETTITAGPRKRTTARKATFRFSASEAGATFQCKLDRGPWRACRSPKTYASLKVGRHTVQVRARDVAGNLDLTPAKRTWQIV